MTTPELKKDYGTELLKTLSIQRQAFIRSVTGERIITNYILYRQMEEELYRIQILIGKYNKKIIKQECDEEKMLYPNFRKEAV